MKKIILMMLFWPGWLAAQWQQCLTPYSGTVMQLESFDGYVWAGTKDGGVYRTNNQISDWIRISTGMTSLFSNQITSLKTIDGDLYAGGRGGLFSLADANAGWVERLNYFNPVNDIAGNANVLLAGMYSDMRRSTDKGLTWQTVTSGLPASNYNVTLMETWAAGGMHVAYLPGHGLFSSFNDGISWVPMPAPGTTGFITMLKVVNNTLYAGVEPLGLYEWSPLISSWTLRSSTGARITDMLIVNNHYLITSSAGILSAQLNGGSFQNVLANAPPFYPPSLSLELSGGQIYIGGANEGVRIIDTLLQAYTDKSQGMRAATVSFLSSSANLLIAHPLNHHYTQSSSDGFATADTLNQPSHNRISDNITDDFSTGQKWYLVSSSRGIIYSGNGGQSFRPANTGLPSNSFQLYAMNAIGAADSGIVIAGTRDGKLFRTVNDTTWTLAYDFTNSNEEIAHLVKAGNYLFAGSRNVIQGFSYLYRSADNGYTWQVVPGPFQFGRDVIGLAYDGVRLVAGSSGFGTFSSTDWGQTWDTINAGLPPFVVFSTMKAYNGSVFVTTVGEKQLYRLLPGANTWQCLNCLPGHPSAVSLTLQNQTLFIGSEDNGVWKWPAFTGSDEFALQNQLLLYPNPSRQTFLTGLQDSKNDFRLEVYDIQGRLVLAQQIQSGPGNVMLDATQWSPGLYLVLLRDNSGTRFQTKWLVND